MTYPYICVAGLDAGSREVTHVRPLPRRDKLDRWLLCRHGGPSDIGSMIDLGSTKCTGTPPETEDHEFDGAAAGLVSCVDGDTLWDLLGSAAKPRLRDIFGPDLQPAGRTMAIEAGKGRASLGCLRPEKPPCLRLNGSGKVRLELIEGDGTLRLPVTDLRIWQEDHQNPSKMSYAPSIAASRMAPRSCSVSVLAGPIAPPSRIGSGTGCR